MFLNYFGNTVRDSPFNLAAARALLGVWLGWKMLWYDWSEFVHTSYRAAVQPSWEWAIPVEAPWLLTVEKWLLIGLLLLVVIGYRVRATATLSAFIAMHLGTVRFTLVTTGETEAIFLGSMMLLFFGLYAEYDRLSLDEIRRSARASPEKLAEQLQSSEDREFAMPQLKYSLLIFAIIFFGSGFDKILKSGGIGWIQPDTLARIITVRSQIYTWDYDIAMVIAEFPLLSSLGAVGTILLETGFLLVVLAGWSITLFALGFIGFTLSNYVVFGIFFADTLFFVSVFLAFDRVHAALATDREVDVVFDDRCRFCMRSLIPFKYFDVAETITFYGQSNAPERYGEREDVDFDRAMYLFHDGKSYEGYDAFRQLFRQYRLFLPVSWIMGLKPVRLLGEPIYRQVARNRSRYFECRGGAKND